MTSRQRNERLSAQSEPFASLLLWFRRHGTRVLTGKRSVIHRVAIVSRETPKRLTPAIWWFKMALQCREMLGLFFFCGSKRVKLYQSSQSQ